MEKKEQKSLIAVLILAIGLALAGFFPGYYFYKTKTGDNSVTVKGLAEMPVKADKAIWKLKFVVTGDDLVVAQRKVSTQATEIDDFLKKSGFVASEINFGRIETTDLLANQYRSGNIDGSRFILTQTITVKSDKVDLVEKMLPKTGDLISKGIVFDGSSYEYPVAYIFTKLNEIKPKMLQEATENAKAAAEEFAKNSGSTVGKIKRANQGVFSILPREDVLGNSETQHIEKTVRVVSTVEYWLE